MGGVGGYGRKLDEFVSSHLGTPVPDSRDLPLHVAPLPEWLENIAFRLVWLLVVINLAGTAFGFWFYSTQLSNTPLVMWPIVPVSPLATLYIALSLAAWRLGYSAEWLHALAFVGCLKYGGWTVFVQVVLNDPSRLELWLYQFLIWSHAGMVVEAFLITRYASFSLRPVAVAAGWFALNDLLDYFIPVLGGPHHPWTTALLDGDTINRALPAFDYMAAASVTATLIGVFLALAVRVELVGRAGDGS